jgi:hypothetical protein
MKEIAGKTILPAEIAEYNEIKYSSSFTYEQYFMRTEFLLQISHKITHSQKLLQPFGISNKFASSVRLSVCP